VILSIALYLSQSRPEDRANWKKIQCTWNLAV